MSFRKNWHISKGVNPRFSSKIQILSSLLIFEKGLDMYFYDVVYKKEGFLDSKNVLHIVEKIAFIHRGLT